MALHTQDAAPAEARWSDLFAGRNAVYSLTFAGSVGLHALNIHATGTVMPTVVADIGGLPLYAWSTTVFIVASVISAALTGPLFRRAGPRGAYLLAASLFAIGTGFCAAAPTMPVLLTGRCVQGLGGGLLYALTYAVVRLVYPRALWSRAIGMESAIWGVGTLAGPAIGGIFAEMGSWRLAFWAMLPFAVTLGMIAYAVLPKAADGESARDDGIAWPQILALSLAVLMLCIAGAAETAALSAAGIGAALALLAGAAAIEQRARVRLLPLGALRLAAPHGAAYAVAALLTVGMQVEVFVPYLLQVLHGRSPLVAGYLAAFPALGWTLGAIATAGLDGDAARRAIRFGPVLSFLGCALLALALPAGGFDAQRVLIMISIGLAILGTGIGTAWPHLIACIYTHAPADETERAAGAVTVVQLSATAGGAAIGGAAVNLAGITTDGAASAAFWLCAVLAVAPLAGASIAMRREASDR